MNKKELQMILAEGEGYRIEFKESLTNIDKDLVAFANSSGGRIFLGVADNKTIKGIEVTNKLKSQVQDIANNCQPAVEIYFEMFRNVLIINVKQGDDKPYKCSSGFYTRVGPNSQKLNRDEIIEFFKAEGKVRFDELVNLKFEYETQFDQKKFDKFLRLAKISNVLDTPSMLVNMGIAERQEGKLIFNNTGILFFAKNLQDIYYHTAVTCALYNGTEKVDVLDRRDFNEDIVSNIDGAMAFLKRYLAVRYEMTGSPRRKEIPEIPYDALREAVINAVAHRDYFEKGANVMVEMFDDRVEITNFGGLAKGLKIEDFGKKSVLRNPNIADLLHRIKYIEKMGTGINKMKSMLAESGLPPAKFEFGNFFTVTFARPKLQASSARTASAGKSGAGDGVKDGVSDGVKDGVSDGVKDGVKLSKNQQKIISLVTNDEWISREELSRKIGISVRNIEKNIAALKRKGLLKRVGPDKGGHWEIIEVRDNDDNDSNDSDCQDKNQDIP